MNAITPFNFDNHEVRVRDQDGQPWFVAADVCAALGIANSRDAIARLDEDERGVVSTDTLGGAQTVSVINESGLYTIILRCRDAMTPGTAPYRFRKWVTSEVLPTIRRTGEFKAAPAPLPEITAEESALQLAHALIAKDADLRIANAKVHELEHRVEVDAPKIAFAESIAAAAGSIEVAAAAQKLGTGQNRLFAFMRQIGWLQRTNRPYQNKIDDGCLEDKANPYRHPKDGSLQHSFKVFVTAKGLIKLQRLWDRYQESQQARAA